MKRLFTILLTASLCAGAWAQTFTFGTATDPDGHTLLVDSYGIVLDGQHILPVMGEIHPSRVPENEWKREIEKMKAGGIDVVSCYLFWNHHEAEEGVYDWSGNRNIRKFIEICRDCGEKVVLRSGPFCHGEVYLGGIPEWMVDKSIADPENYALRTLAPGFIDAVSKWYNAVFSQVQGLLWKDGGPIIGIQVDNESPGPWPYLATLKRKVIEAGFDLPFYTRTGWPQMQGPAVFGEILPLYGDYADGFWDRTLDEMPGSYRDAFHFRDSRLSAVIATEVFGTDQSTEMDKEDLQYPYFTCELGGGMMTSYHRRIRIFDKDALALAVCKVGSGSNLPGYYMYHGGTNPYCAEHSMAEFQASKFTDWNDLPHMTYDFQAPLGEMGRPNMSFHYIRILHQMLRDWGSELSLMPTEIGEGDLRTAVRSKDGSSFVFVNNYERLATLGDKNWTFQGQDIVVPDGASFVFPVGLKYNGITIDWATAQPFCKTTKTLYLVAVDGIVPKVSVGGKVYTPKCNKAFKAEGVKIVVLSPEKAVKAYKVSDDKVVFAKGVVYEEDGALKQEIWKNKKLVKTVKLAEAGPLRVINMGKQHVAEQPSEAEYDAAAKWSLQLPEVKDPENWFVEVSYKGDVARVYADGRLVEDNFWNGRTMLVRMSDIAGKDAQLWILPLRKEAPIYLPREQKAELEAAQGDSLLELGDVRLIHRVTKKY